MAKNQRLKSLYEEEAKLVAALESLRGHIQTMKSLYELEDDEEIKTPITPIVKKTPSIDLNAALEKSKRGVQNWPTNYKDAVIQREKVYAIIYMVGEKGADSEEIAKEIQKYDPNWQAEFPTFRALERMVENKVTELRDKWKKIISEKVSGRRKKVHYIK